MRLQRYGVSCLVVLAVPLIVYASLHWHRHKPTNQPQAIASVARPQCGQFAVHFECLRHGLPVSMDDICKILPPKPAGESLLELSEAIQKLGLRCEGRRQTWEELCKDEFPVILHGRDHFFVVDWVRADGTVGIVDGEGVRRLISRDELASQWDGTALCVSSPPASSQASNAAIVPAHSAAARFNTLDLDAGEINRSQSEVRYAFPFTNSGSKPLTLSARASCGCVALDYPQRPVLPGERAELVARYNVSGERGPFGKYIAFQSNDPKFPAIMLHVGGYVVDQLLASPLYISFGRMSVGETRVEHLVVRRFSLVPFRITGIDCSVQDVTPVFTGADAASLNAITSAGSDRSWSLDDYRNMYILTLTLRAKSPSQGYEEGVLTVATDLPAYDPIHVRIGVQVTPR